MLNQVQQLQFLNLAKTLSPESCKEICSVVLAYPSGGPFDPSICPTIPVTCTQHIQGQEQKNRQIEKSTSQKHAVNVPTTMLLYHHRI